MREVADSLRLQRRPGVELRVEEGLPEFPRHGVQEGACPGAEQLYAQCTEIYRKRIGNDSDSAGFPATSVSTSATTGIGIGARRPGTHLRTFRQTRHLHPGDRARAVDLQVDRRNSWAARSASTPWRAKAPVSRIDIPAGSNPQNPRPSRAQNRTETTGTVIAPKPDADSPDEGKPPQTPLSRNGDP